MKKLKYLKYFDSFNSTQYVVGDTVKINYQNQELLAIIKKVNTKNSYIVNIVKYNIQMPKPIEIKGENIIQMMKSNSTPAMSQDWTTRQFTTPSNDLVINGGYPDTPVTNIFK